MTNALQHTPETGHITVRVGTSAEDGILEVVDEGPGMSQEDALYAYSSGSIAPTPRARGAAAVAVWGCRSWTH